MVVAFRRHTLLPLDDCLYEPRAPGFTTGLTANSPISKLMNMMKRNRDF